MPVIWPSERLCEVVVVVEAPEVAAGTDVTVEAVLRPTLEAPVAGAPNNELADCVIAGGTESDPESVAIAVAVCIADGAGILEGSEALDIVAPPPSVAVMIVAVSGTALATPAQIEYTPTFSSSWPLQLENTHCNPPSPIVSPESLIVVHRKSRLSLSLQLLSVYCDWTNSSTQDTAHEGTAVMSVSGTHTLSRFGSRRESSDKLDDLFLFRGYISSA